MEVNVNGVTHAISSAPLTSLLEVLREELNILSPKVGCQQGACGTCTVLVDGEPRRSCLLPVVSVEAAEVLGADGGRLMAATCCEQGAVLCDLNAGRVARASLHSDAWA